MNDIQKAILSSPSLWPATLKSCACRFLGVKNTIVATHGIRMLANLERGKGLWCSVGGLEYEPEMRDALSLLGAGDVFVDVGANVGVYTLHAARRVGPSGKVFFFEPTTETYERTCENVKLNGFSNIKGFQKAVAAAEGTVDFMVCESNNSNYIGSGLLSQEERESVEVRTVPVDTVDALAARENLDRVDLIKIDAEGAETLVMKGAAGILGKSRPSVLFESGFVGSPLSERAFLREQGYKLYRLEGKKWVEGLDEFYGNVLGIARDEHARKLGIAR
ncbi:FkbM family methyltransferase [Luteolibacter sp. GHJ8]|uniref:FkbM family methyltransferase n=1 Tax=Luteolibacter rhizosphaerae TaxID=2989719 RepID=A0ABT3FZL8_9BACT|nr:FkbM family methyltransferase [Luteolibacter rhizosphaerae]MCW1912689.1 FkbM family methyltransferase [Luteolibacter rhizosphaerae]